MNSMTGHGRGDATVNSIRAFVECASVNRKQAEVVLSTSREALGVEPLVREIVLARITRGRVTVSLELSSAKSESSGLIDHSRAKAYLKEIRCLQKELHIPGAPDIGTVLAGPGVVRQQTLRGDPWPATHQALVKALEGMLTMRSREGAHLARSLARDVTRLATLVRQVKPLASRVPARHREALFERLTRARIPIDAGDPRFVTETALFAERCDVSEEIERLASHTAQFREKLATKGPVGRTLEFLVQEMSREWNTLGAKAADAGISRFVVEAKAALDKLREQLANIE